MFRLLVALALFLSPLGYADESLSVPGLEEPVQIVKDKWGISHIYAKNQHDLFFAQGWNAARDRLFQFEMWRRHATGTLAEIEGEKAFAHDRGARLLRYRGDVAEEMAHYHKDGVEIVTAFVEGVNAWIQRTREHPELLPFEFKLLGIEPGLFTPAIVLSRHNALTGGVSSEIRLAQLITAVGPETTEHLLDFEREPYLQPRQGIDLKAIDMSIMDDYVASRSLPPFDNSDLAAPAAASALDRLNQVSSIAMDNPFDPALGSNNWVIAGKRTQSGKPMMANDPHRRIEDPSLRYMVHLNAPGWNVIGAGEPVLPGVSIGHNDDGAWGLTVFHIDQEDLYVYRTNPADPDQYWYKGAWKNMEIEQDTVHVRGEADKPITLKYTVHGPVLKEDPAHHVAYAMRAVWLEAGAAPYLASLRMDQAKSWDEFRAACGYSGLPGENMVWADRKGNIGWQAVGFTPIRVGWAGRLPVPGDGDYEWQGMVPITAMPHLENPANGFYATANNMNVPAGYPNIFSDFYSDPARVNRIDEVLAANKAVTIADSEHLQYDTKSMNAEAIVPVLVRAGIPRKAKSLLTHWDYRLDRDSAAAALFDRWEKIMLARLNEKLVPGRSEVSELKMKDWIISPPAFVFGTHPQAGRDSLMQEAMRSAIAQLDSELGPDMSAWRYGETHVVEIDHPLASLVSSEMRKRVNLGPLPRGGGDNTVNANHGGEKQTSGASFRIIVDTADWDATVGTNTPGQSGNPASKHYGDLFEAWNRGDYFPMYFTRDKIDSVTDAVTNLVPKQD